MFSNYLKIAWRNFLRNKSYSVINILGLSLGLACLVLISLFVTEELSYDKFHEDSEQIHYLGLESRYGESSNKGLSTPRPLGASMEQEIPEVKQHVTTLWPGNGQISIDGEEFFGDTRILMSSEQFFEIFSFPLKTGDPKTVLADPNSVVIAQSIAEKYFPNENPIGKTIYVKYYGDNELVISGVAKDIGENSYVRFDVVASIKGNNSYINLEEAWGASMFNTYVKLYPDTDWDQVQPKLEEVTSKYLGEESNSSFFSIPLTDLYFSEFVSSTGFKGDMKYIYIFSAIGIFILLLASINYMNLATSRATMRSLEVGVRKVVGAEKKQLIMQFLSEAIIVTVVSFLFSLLLVEFALPYFNSLLDHNLVLNFSTDWQFIAALFLISICIGIGSGAYPAFYLSRFNPSRALKGSVKNLNAKFSFRKALVVTQFTVSTVLIISTIVAFSQLRFLLNKDLGFKSEQVMFINAYQISDQIDVFKENILQHSAVINASAATDLPGRISLSMGMSFDPSQPDLNLQTSVIRADEDYDEVLGLTMKAGRFFDENYPSDLEKARVINEAMVTALGWAGPEEAIGKVFVDSSEVIGVVSDFNFKSLHSEIGSLLLQMGDHDSRYQNYSQIAIKFNAEEVQPLIAYLQEEWAKLSPASPLDYRFLEDRFAELYETDRKLSYAFMTFAGIAIFIACMGLFGLVTYSTQRRTKEIGIRKVLGASLKDLLTLLSREYLLLVGLGFAISIPVAWYAMNEWLAEFAYRIEIGVGIFLLAGFASISIALITVVFNSTKAALANPVDSLKTE
ncbi:MAG: ABC transporter permease [Balneola sp.]|nr:MAG: ABC transporter permease [Balneola sp.]